MWDDMLISGIPLVEKVIRTVIVYLSVVFLLRLMGRRDLAQLSPFDIVVMLLLSNVVQNAIIGPDNSVTGAVVGSVTLLTANSLLARAASSWDRLGSILEGRTTILARDGAYEPGAVRRLALRRADLDVAIKRQGGDHVTDVSEMTIGPGGQVVVRLLPAEEDASAGDIAQLNARLDRIEQTLAELNRRLA
ncbi:YetF domain-containing protein [Nonomuraea sp. NPDC046570]|uniref:DUF421 domain-containing protein n=1 Tax=Nonomuraea sp. NPDC046570 TaxID=3155255 RepID=UPI0034111607